MLAIKIKMNACFLVTEHCSDGLEFSYLTS